MSLAVVTRCTPATREGKVRAFTPVAAPLSVSATFFCFQAPVAHCVLSSKFPFLIRLPRAGFTDPIIIFQNARLECILIWLDQIGALTSFISSTILIVLASLRSDYAADTAITVDILIYYYLVFAKLSLMLQSKERGISNRVP